MCGYLPFANHIEDIAKGNSRVSGDDPFGQADHEGDDPFSLSGDADEDDGERARSSRTSQGKLSHFER